MKVKSLGTAVTAARGILATAITTGTPLQISITAGHRQRNGSRIAIAGDTQGNTFGEWNLSGVAAGSAQLDGSSGTAALSGTMVVAAVCDQTPFLPRNAAVALVSTLGLAATSTGTAVFEKADGQSAGGFTYTNSSGVITAGFQDALMSGEIAIPAFGNAGSLAVEVSLSRYMTFRMSAWTSGVFAGNLVA